MRGSAWYHSHIWSRIFLLIWRCTFNLALRCRLLLAVALERPAVWIGEKRLQYFPDWVWLNILEPQTRWLHSSKYTHTHILVCQAETMRRVVQGTLPSNLQDFVAFWAKTVAVCHLQSSHICHIGSLSQFAHDFYEDLEPFHWTQILFGPVQTICGFHKWHYPNSWMVYNPKQPWMIKRGPFMETPIWPMAFHQSILISVTPRCHHDRLRRGQTPRPEDVFGCCPLDEPLRTSRKGVESWGFRGWGKGRGFERVTWDSTSM